MPSGIPEGASCVQRFDDSRNSAIHITYRISLRSSSMPEPRDPLLKFLMIKNHTQTDTRFTRVQMGSPAGAGRGGFTPPGDQKQAPRWARRSNTVQLNT